jgi:hypothetical protein
MPLKQNKINIENNPWVSLSINEHDKNEFIGQIIDTFEDFLENHEVRLENSNDDAIITGSDYDSLKTEIGQLMDNWNR